MVKRVLFSTIIGALIYFFFGMFTWMVLPYHGQTLNKFSNEEVVISALKDSASTSGIYVSPKFGEKPDTAAQEPQSLIFVSVKHEGYDPSMRTQMLQAAGVNLVGAFLISLLLLYAARTAYLCRLIFVILLGATIGLLGEAPYHVWWGFSLPFVITNMLDSIVGWGLAGIFMAAIIKKKEA